MGFLNLNTELPRFCTQCKYYLQTCSKQYNARNIMQSVYQQHAANMFSHLETLCHMLHYIDPGLNTLSHNNCL